MSDMSASLETVSHFALMSDKVFNADDVSACTGLDPKVVEQCLERLLADAQVRSVGRQMYFKQLQAPKLPKQPKQRLPMVDIKALQRNLEIFENERLRGLESARKMKQDLEKHQRLIAESIKKANHFIKIFERKP